MHYLNRKIDMFLSDWREDPDRKPLIVSDRYPDICHGIKLTGGNIGLSGNFNTLPYFCAFLIKRYIKQNDLLNKNLKKVLGIITQL